MTTNRQAKWSLAASIAEGPRPPCDTCLSYRSCKVSGMTCEAFRAYANNPREMRVRLKEAKRRGTLVRMFTPNMAWGRWRELGAHNERIEALKIKAGRVQGV